MLNLNPESKNLRQAIAGQTEIHSFLKRLLHEHGLQNIKRKHRERSKTKLKAEAKVEAEIKVNAEAKAGVEVEAKAETESIIAKDKA